MDLRQVPPSEHLSINMQGQHQQPVFSPLNPVLQTSTAHVMPTPTSNWNIESMPWKITTVQSGDVMEFTAHAPHKNNEMRRAILHQKRKSELNTNALLPVKQFISEEKITAHFNGLHISSDYIQNRSSSDITDNHGDEIPSTSGKCFSNLTYEDYQITAKELEQKLRNANRITVCEELKKFNDEQKKVSYLPEALLHRIHKPCTALVLWQPSPVMNMFSQKNSNVNSSSNEEQPQQDDAIDDYTIPDVDLPPIQRENIDDFIDNNNTCNLDFNNIKPDSMDEDL